MTARPTASYVNWIGRTVRQIREEATLRSGAGRARRANCGDGLPRCRPARLRDQLLDFVRGEVGRAPARR